MPPKTQHQERRRSREAAIQVLFSAHFAVGAPVPAAVAETEARFARRLRHHYQMHLSYVAPLADEMLSDIVYEGLPAARAEVLRLEVRQMLEEADAVAFNIGYVEDVQRIVGKLDNHLDHALREWRVQRRALVNPELVPEALATDAPVPAAVDLPDLVKRWTSGWTRIRQHAATEQDVYEPTVFTQQLLTLVDKYRAHLDAVIDGSLQGWSPERLGVSERSILRLGTAELLYCDDIPAAATIDEYVDMAIDYADDNAAKFINGVLDRIRVEHAPAAKSKAAGKPPAKGARNGHA